MKTGYCKCGHAAGAHEVRDPSKGVILADCICAHFDGDCTCGRFRPDPARTVGRDIIAGVQ